MSISAHFDQKLTFTDCPCRDRPRHSGADLETDLDTVGQTSTQLPRHSSPMETDTQIRGQLRALIRRLTPLREHIAVNIGGDSAASPSRPTRPRLRGAAPWSTSGLQSTARRAFQLAGPNVPGPVASDVDELLQLSSATIDPCAFAAINLTAISISTDSTALHHRSLAYATPGVRDRHAKPAADGSALGPRLL